MWQKRLMKGEHLVFHYGAAYENHNPLPLIFVLPVLQRKLSNLH
jgi:hypothetical protein